MYVVLVLFIVKPGAVDRFRAAVLLQAENSLSGEVACRRFDVAFDDERPERCLLYELYDDRAAFDAHLTTDHFKRFDEATADLVASKDVSCWRLAAGQETSPC